MTDTDPELTERRRRGLKVLKELGFEDNPALKDLDEELWGLVTDSNFGDIWSRPGLTLREREMIVIAILITLGANGVKLHFKNAHAVGISTEQVREIIFQTIPYAGLPKVLQAMDNLKQVLANKPISL